MKTCHAVFGRFDFYSVTTALLTGFKGKHRKSMILLTFIGKSSQMMLNGVDNCSKNVKPIIAPQKAANCAGMRVIN